MNEIITEENSTIEYDEATVEERGEFLKGFVWPAVVGQDAWQRKPMAEEMAGRRSTAASAAPVEIWASGWTLRQDPVVGKIMRNLNFRCGGLQHLILTFRHVAKHH